MSAKHKWFLTNRHGMLRNLLVQDYKPGVIKPVIGVITLVFFLSCFTSMYERAVKTQAQQLLFFLWAFSTDYEELMAFDGWKNITAEDEIIKRLIRRNTTHLVQSANTPFASGYLSGL